MVVTKRIRQEHRIVMKELKDKPMARQPNKTIKLTLYLYRNKTRTGREQGVVYLCNEFGKVTRKKKDFDHLTDIGPAIEELIREGGMDYPPLKEAQTTKVPAANGSDNMIRIKFVDRQSQIEALGFLATHFCGRAFRSGEVIVPGAALAALVAESFSFTVIGRATHDQIASLRDSLAAQVQ